MMGISTSALSYGCSSACMSVCVCVCVKSASVTKLPRLDCGRRKAKMGRTEKRKAKALCVKIKRLLLDSGSLVA